VIIAFFVVAGPTALFFLTGGVMKLVRPVTALRDAAWGGSTTFRQEPLRCYMWNP
jgi:hypothetical protein